VTVPVTSPVRPPLTRQTALEAARLLYAELVVEALKVEGADAEYLIATAGDWDRRMAALVRYRSDVTLPDHTRDAFEFLRKSILNPIDDDALVRWVETFPDSVAELFPPSPATFWLPSREATVSETQSGTAVPQAA
jgi:hypothetical protein